MCVVLSIPQAFSLSAEMSWPWCMINHPSEEIDKVFNKLPVGGFIVATPPGGQGETGPVRLAVLYKAETKLEALPVEVEAEDDGMFLSL